MKKRLLVMNGQKLVQNQNDSSAEWKTEKVIKSEGIKPGIYNLYNAIDADQSKENIGEVIHIDKKENMLYQRVGTQYIKHDLSCFEQIPQTGHLTTIKYENNKINSIEISKKHIKTIKI